MVFPGEREELTYKLILIGEPSTGKSSILRRYCENQFKDEYKCTIGVDFKTKVIKMLNGEIVKLQVWDTAGQERFRTMTASYYRGSSGCLIVYDICRMDTFKAIEDWIQQYRKNYNMPTPPVIALVGNKADLEHLREVEIQEAKQLARQLGCTHFEVSAKAGEHEIKHMFEFIGLQLYKSASDHQSKSSASKISGGKKESNKGGVITAAQLHKESKKERKKKGCCK